MRQVYGFLIFAVALSLPAEFGVQAQDYSITRYTIDGGGTVDSTGGGYVLSGTIGQADAGVFVGDGYQLTGGFWFEAPRGDCNADGLVNLLDHADFVPCLDGPGAGWTDPNCRCFDFDGDSDIDLRDFAGFVALFAG